MPKPTPATVFGGCGMPLPYDATNGHWIIAFLRYQVLNLRDSATADETPLLAVVFSNQQSSQPVSRIPTSFLYVLPPARCHQQDIKIPPRLRSKRRCKNTNKIRNNKKNNLLYKKKHQMPPHPIRMPSLRNASIDVLSNQHTCPFPFEVNNSQPFLLSNLFIMRPTSARSLQRRAARKTRSSRVL